MLAYVVRRHGGPEVLEPEERATPALRPDEALVAVRACALNHLDLWVREGVPGHTFPLPLVPGSEIAGDVVAVGEAVRGFAPGDPVLVAPGVSCGRCPACLSGNDPLCPEYGILGETRDGGFAEAVVVPGRNLLPLPRGLSYVEAAATPLVFLTAWHMLVTRARLRPNEDVLVTGAGSGVATAGVQIARLLHARTIVATSRSEEKLARARELGATHGVLAGDGMVAAVRAIVGRKGVDVAFEHVGGDTFRAALRLLGAGGRLVLCGATSGASAEINLRAVFFKSLSILGSTMGSLAELRALLPFFERGLLRPVVDRVVPLAEAAEAQQVLSRGDQFGKVVLAVGDPDVARRPPARGEPERGGGAAGVPRR